MNNEKLKSTLQYCLENLRHPETPIYNNFPYYGDGYTIQQSLKTSEQILKEATIELKKAEMRALKVKNYEDTIENIKEILKELE